MSIFNTRTQPINQSTKGLWQPYMSIFNIRILKVLLLLNIFTPQDDLGWVIVPSEPNNGVQITFTMYQMEIDVSKTSCLCMLAHLLLRDCNNYIGRLVRKA